MRTFVVSDIHGSNKALVQCLERAGFDKEVDRLICLGDVCDRGLETYEVVETLLSVKNLVSIKGNHDDWFLSWLEANKHPTDFLQGGKETVDSYVRVSGLDPNWTGGYKTTLTARDIVPTTHINFFKSQLLYFKDEVNNVYVHAGFHPQVTLEENASGDPQNMYWDRHFYKIAYSAQEKGATMYYAEQPIKNVFIGHTPVGFIATKEDGERVTIPLRFSNVVMMDGGAGGFAKGRLNLLNVETGECYQSDTAHELYPGRW